MDWMMVIWLIVAATVLIAIDFFVPGFILALFGGCLMLVALGVAFVNHGFGPALATLLVEIVIGGTAMFISMKYGPNTPMGRKLTLGENQTGTSAHTDADTGLIGQAGTAHTLLRPSGTATISGKRLDVVAESGIIERGSPVKVVAIQENKIIVRKT